MNDEAHGSPRIVLAQCYGTLLALYDDAGPLVKPAIASDLANIERVMGDTGKAWRTKRLAEQETTA